MVILSAKDITKTYGVDTILENVSFHVNEGDRIGIVGANGAGKTTLLNILSGQLAADGGNFFMSQNQVIGYLKQKDNFDRENTVLEEIHKIFKPLEEMEKELTALSLKISELGAEAGCEMNRYAALTETFKNEGGYSYKSEISGILNSMAFGEEYYDKKISTLSGGERTRLALACLLLEKPDILFLDEPTNHLDVKYQLQLLNTVKSLDLTVVAAFHDLNLAGLYCDEIYVLKDGRVRAAGAPWEVLTAPLIEEVYGVHADILPGKDGNPRIIYYAG